MILKIRKNGGFVYIDNMYTVEVVEINKAAFRGNEKGDKSMWIEDIDPASGRPDEPGYYVSAQKYMYEHNECRTVKLTSYIIDSGYLLNDDGKTVEALIKRD